MSARDAHLPSWAELTDRHAYPALLLGNGASRALWKPFGYYSLFEQAQQVRHKALAISDQALFKALGTELFEPVLSALNTTIRSNAALAINSTAPLNRYYSIKQALIHALRAVHLPLALLPPVTLGQLNAELRRYRCVYTSNYDLILPWAMEHDPSGFAELFDEQGSFDVRRTAGAGTRVLHVHGGLHLLRQADGTTRRRGAVGSELLDGAAVNVPGEVPLFINEGPSAQKLQAIRSSDYLSWCLAQLACEAGNLCLLGQHLDSADEHLLEAIVQARPARIAVAIRPLGEASVHNQQSYFSQRLAAVGCALDFFDASTHPLAQTTLSIAFPASRRR
ncbi:DUF4917 family protein [Pseudomonas cremoricolorata]|uniref:DUF4917 family protein n=1 Tax=Pseudomonas cremoricolorata TaxID=157783 RepID=UPI00041DFCA5|nr:DUF4917 family protein [Pseudomonas cremoricolorata]